MSVTRLSGLVKMRVRAVLCPGLKRADIGCRQQSRPKGCDKKQEIRVHVQQHARPLITISDLLHVVPRYRKLWNATKVSLTFDGITARMWQNSDKRPRRVKCLRYLAPQPGHVRP